MATSKKANDLSMFKSKFDPDTVIPNKIRTAFEKMAAEGPEHWLYEADFMKLAEISTTHLAQYRPQFEKHIVSVKERKNDKRVWFWDAKVAAKVQGG